MDVKLIELSNHIDELRKILNDKSISLLNSSENYREILMISKELDLLILEYDMLINVKNVE